MRIKRWQFNKGYKFVAIGGGTGLPVLLKGLKQHTSNITAIVNVADDGGSSGVIKNEFDILPPGDIRNCLLALAENEGKIKELFDYRFCRGKELAGHNLGNLLLAGMSDLKGDFYSAVQEFEKILAVRGKVLPSTLSKVTLNAETSSGMVIQGQTGINETEEKIESVFLIPKKPDPSPGVIEAILAADVVVLGPGSLFTSVLPNLLVGAVKEALRKTSAKIFYVCNIMTEPGETGGYDASDHYCALSKHLGHGVIDSIVVNNEKVPESLRAKYGEGLVSPVLYNANRLKKLGLEVVEASLVDKGKYIRHDPIRLSQAILGNGCVSDNDIVEYFYISKKKRNFD